MFPSRYFNARYWAKRYWAKVGAILNAGSTDVDQLKISRVDVMAIKSVTDKLEIKSVS